MFIDKKDEQTLDPTFQHMCLIHYSLIKVNTHGDEGGSWNNIYSFIFI